MKLNLDLKYKMYPKGEGNKELTGPELTRLVLTNFVGAKYGDKPMPKSDSRIWAKIQDELADNKDAAELDGTSFDWLADIVKDTDLPSGFSSWLWVVRNYFERAKEDNEDAPSGKLEAVK